MDCGNCILGISVYLEWRVCTDAQNEAGYDRTGGIGWNQLLMWINPPLPKAETCLSQNDINKICIEGPLVTTVKNILHICDGGEEGVCL